MKRYVITNNATGEDMGLYIANSEDEALGLLAGDAGYADFEEACRYRAFRDEDITIEQV